MLPLTYHKQKNGFYEIGSWKINVPCDIEIYKEYKDSEPELIPHSLHGEQFIKNCTEEERNEFISNSVL